MSFQWTKWGLLALGCMVGGCSGGGSPSQTPVQDGGAPKTLGGSQGSTAEGSGSKEGPKSPDGWQAQGKADECRRAQEAWIVQHLPPGATKSGNEALKALLRDRALLNEMPSCSPP